MGAIPLTRCRPQAAFGRTRAVVSAAGPGTRRPLTPAPITLCGSLSLHPVSLGAAMHRAGYAKLGLPFVYVPFAVKDVAGALQGMRALGIRGFGVSMPYKLEVMPHLDRIDPHAEAIGAVNTIVNDDGVLTGHNTDAYGAVAALREALPVLDGAPVLIVGAGGAARAVAHALVAAHARVTIVNRTASKADQLAQRVGAAASTLDAVAKLDGYAALVNASSAGMTEYGPGSPVPVASLRPGLVVMDIVYKPIHTQLLAAARAAGATTVHGGRMLLHQACRQFELYTGRDAPIDAMDDALRAQIGG